MAGSPSQYSHGVVAPALTTSPGPAALATVVLSSPALNTIGMGGVVKFDEGARISVGEVNRFIGL